ncbi:MAG TPA: thiamine-phosphate kinase [Mycobacteriales bacterium]|nr:thiamine-phosphate kinase [Mycobacteriales bacterium]
MARGGSCEPDRIRREGKAVISVSGADPSGLRGLGEFGLIARIAARLPQGVDVAVGPGDDAAVIETPDGRVVATVDLLVEGRHFRRDWSTGYDVGRRAAAASLADVVAMGARPTALLVGFAAPADLDVSWADELADGLRDEAALVGASVVGGDITAADRICVSVTGLGDLDGRAPITRAGAAPGDAVVVVGRLGWAAAGLAVLEAGRHTHPLAAAHRRPEVAYSSARELAATGNVTAMIDVSDGLLADLGHLATASGVSIRLDSRRLPIDPEVAAAAAELGTDPLLWVAAGGDDHAFAVTVRGEVPPQLPVVGEVVATEAGSSRVWFADRETPETGGHDHFRVS